MAVSMAKRRSHLSNTINDICQDGLGFGMTLAHRQMALIARPDARISTCIGIFEVKDVPFDLLKCGHLSNIACGYI